MKREEAYQILTKYLKSPNLIKHCLSTEAAMKGLCKYLNPQASKTEIETWGITGLLHDADYEMTKNNPDKHGLLLFEKSDVTFPNDIKHAIQSHNFAYTKVIPESKMDWAIATCDQLTGLIIASTLVLADKKIASLSTQSVLKRFKEPSFAKGADRKIVGLCEEKLGIPLPTFVEITLKAMQEISNQLGL